MIQYYGITPKETSGNVVFVLKFNECQVVKGQILDHISVTWINQAFIGKPLESQEIDASQYKDDRGKINKKGYYGIKLEKNIWWQTV